MPTELVGVVSVEETIKVVRAESIKALNRIANYGSVVVQTVDVPDEGEKERNALLIDMQRERCAVISLQFYTNAQGARMLTIVYRQV